MSKLPLFILGTFIFFSLLFLTPLLKVKHIQISKQECLTQSKLNEDLDILGKYIFLVSEQELADEIKSKYPCIDSVVVEKKLLNSLNLDVREISAVFKAQNTNFYLTREGVVIDGAAENAPTIHIPNNPKLAVGQKITDDSVIFALQVGSELVKSDFSLSDLRIINSLEIVAYDTKGFAAVFSSNKDSKSQVDSLQLVLSTAKIDGTKIEKIDLRFDKPVIVYK